MSIIRWRLHAGYKGAVSVMNFAPLRKGPHTSQTASWCKDNISKIPIFVSRSFCLSIKRAERSCQECQQEVRATVAQCAQTWHANGRRLMMKMCAKLLTKYGRWIMDNVIAKNVAHKLNTISGCGPSLSYWVKAIAKLHCGCSSTRSCWVMGSTQ